MWKRTGPGEGICARLGGGNVQELIEKISNLRLTRLPKWEPSLSVCVRVNLDLTPTQIVGLNSTHRPGFNSDASERLAV
jgi:hypothetical protein